MSEPFGSPEASEQRVEWSAGAIDQVSEDANNEQRDDHDRGNGRRNQH